MTEPSIILLLSRLMLALVALLALVSYLRARDRAHLEVTLMLACVAIPGMSGLLPDDLLPAWFSNSNAILLSAQPYLALRLVAFFKPVPRWVMLPATAGLALSWVAVVLDEQPLETATIFGVLVYILAATLYATWAFYQGMRHSGGAFRGRLGSAAAGSGLMALTFVALGLGSIAPGIADVATDFLPMLVAVAFYLAFIPPRWLRQAWQLPELHRFLTQLAFSNPLDRLNRAGLDLCGTTTRLTDGTGSAVLHWDASKRQLVTEATDNPLLAGQEYGPDEGVIGRVWRDRVPLLVASGEELGEKESWIAKTLESHALLAVPIEGLESARGVLLAFRPRGKLFASDLLEMMQLLAAQYAITLENAELLSEQQRLVEFLRSANEEMEAFSYSVSHDLRRPLRGIDGFSDALLQDYGDRLDAQGVDYLNRVRLAAQSMGHLIDDLLKLSRLSTEAMEVLEVDLSEMACSIAESLRREDPKRRVEFVIPDGVTAWGDPSFIQQVLDNLLDNAWKFTSRQEDAVIEFGVEETEEGPAYFVKDNGTGFDPAYAEKLFGPFQRLHSPHDFPGTGIGLATVRWIVRRHGGHAWAEGAVGKGASIYFTLPPKGRENELSDRRRRTGDIVGGGLPR